MFLLFWCHWHQIHHSKSIKAYFLFSTFWCLTFVKLLPVFLSASPYMTWITTTSIFLILLWLALTTSVCLLDYLLHLCFSLHFVLCKASGVKSLLQDNTADKTSRYHQSAVIEAGFISRFIMGLLYLCFYNFTYLYAFYCCRETDYLLGNACHQRHDIDKISFELDGLKNNNISEKTAEISTFNSKPNIPIDITYSTYPKLSLSMTDIPGAWTLLPYKMALEQPKRA